MTLYITKEELNNSNGKAKDTNQIGNAEDNANGKTIPLTPVYVVESFESSLTLDELRGLVNNLEKDEIEDFELEISVVEESCPINYMIGPDYLRSLKDIMLSFHSRVFVDIKHKSFTLYIHKQKKDIFHKGYDHKEIYLNTIDRLSSKIFSFSFNFYDMINYLKILSIDRILNISEMEMRVLFYDKHRNDDVSFINEALGISLYRKGRDALSLMKYDIDNNLDRHVVCISREVIEKSMISEGLKILYNSPLENSNDTSLISCLEYKVLMHELGHQVFSYIKEEKTKLYNENQANYFASMMCNGYFDDEIRLMAKNQGSNYYSIVHHNDKQLEIPFLYSDLFNNDLDIQIIDLLYQGDDSLWQ